MSDQLKGCVATIGAIIAGFCGISALVFVIAAITEGRPWFLIFTVLSALLGYGFYQAFTSD
jgi:CHASE2 domain-containing sensor protein